MNGRVATVLAAGDDGDGGGIDSGGAIYSTTEWIARHRNESQALANAMVETLNWIHSHGH